MQDSPRQRVRQRPGQRPRDRARDAVGAWVAAVTQRPRRALAAVAVLLVLALIGVLGLGIDTDSSHMLADDLPFRERAHALDAAFPGVKDTIVVAVRAEVSDAADAATAALARDLARRDDVFSRVFAPSANPYLEAHGLLYLDTAALDSRLSRLGRSANLLATLRANQSFPGFLGALDSATRQAEAAGEAGAGLEPLYAEAAAVLAAERRGQDRPFGWTEALGGETRGGEALEGDAGDATIRLITLRPRLDYSELRPARPALAAIDETIAGLDPGLAEPVEIGVTGEPALRAEEFASVARSLPVSLGLSILLVGILLRFALGSGARAGLALGTLGVTLMLTAGFAGAAVGTLNLVSIAFVVLMVGLGIDYAIHLISHFDEHRTEVSSRRVALVRSGQALGPAVVVSAATTALAFFAFATTDFVGMAQLGLIGGAGVLIALGCALTVIPAAVMLWPGLDAGPLPPRLRQPPARVRGALRWLTLALGLGALALAPGARFDANPMNLRAQDAASVQAYQWLAAEPELTPLRLNLVAEDDAAARDAAERLEALPQVRAARWLGDLVPSGQQAKLDLIDLAYPSILHAVEGAPADLDADSGEDTQEVTPEALAGRLAERPGAGAAALAGELSAYAERRSALRDAALGGEVFRYFPMLIERLRSQLDADEVTVESLPAALRDRYRAGDGRLRVEILPAADVREPAARADFVEAVHGVAPDAAGPVDLIHGAARAVGGAILEATLLALVGCTLLAWVMLRDAARVGAILLPLFLAAAVTVGASVLLGLPFNYANVLVLPLLIGLGIDSGVHVALRASRITGSVFDTSTPRAVLYSALTTVAAFGTLGLSDHRGTASMGILLAIAVLAVVATTFNLTPALIRAIRRMLGDPVAGA